MLRQDNLCPTLPFCRHQTSFDFYIVWHQYYLYSFPVENLTSFHIENNDRWFNMLYNVVYVCVTRHWQVNHLNKKPLGQ